MTIYTKQRLQWITIIGLDHMLRLNRLTITPQFKKNIEDTFLDEIRVSVLIHQLK